MEKPHFGQTDNDKLQSKQEFEEKLESQHETTEPRARENEIDIRKVTTTENSEEHKQGSNLKEMKVDDQTINSSSLGEVENLQEFPTINFSDVFSNEKFGHDLLQLIENGQSLENWHHSNYQDITTDSFSSQMQMESAQICPIQQCINASIQTMNESTVTLTVLNATNTDEPTQPISFSVAQLSTPENSVDHDYCTYPRPGYSKTSHGTVGTSGPVHSEQHELGMDEEKLQRMKRRKEKNRECSRQFRLKQKNKEESLKNGKIEKIQNLESLRRNVENLKTTLSKVASQCCPKCPQTRMLLSKFNVVDKENINPDYMKIIK